MVVLGLIAWAIWAAKPSWAMLVSGGIWVAFLLYWSAKARTPTPTVKAETRRSSLKHSAWRELGLLFLFIPVPWLNQVLLPNGPLHHFVGLGVQLLGAWFYLYAKGYLGRQWSGSISIKTDHQLITSGPYRRIRHPMYTGMITMALGTAMVSTRLHALIGAALVAVSYVVTIGIEEAWLGTHFGAAYDEWRSHSWKLLPADLLDGDCADNPAKLRQLLGFGSGVGDGGGAFEFQVSYTTFHVVPSFLQTSRYFATSFAWPCGPSDSSVSVPMSVAKSPPGETSIPFGLDPEHQARGLY